MRLREAKMRRKKSISTSTGPPEIQRRSPLGRSRLGLLFLEFGPNVNRGERTLGRFVVPFGASGSAPDRLHESHHARGRRECAPRRERTDIREESNRIPCRRSRSFFRHHLRCHRRQTRTIESGSRSGCSRSDGIAVRSRRARSDAGGDARRRRFRPAARADGRNGGRRFECSARSFARSGTEGGIRARSRSDR